MKTVILLFGVFILLMCVVGLLSPARLMGMVGWVRKRPGFLIAVALRVTLGVILYLGAPACRFPLVIQILGVITILAGIGLLFIGRRRFISIVDHIMKWPPAAVRGWLLVGLAFGGFLVYAAS